MNLDNLQFNEYQTKLTEDLLNELPKEVREQLIELINTVPYIQRLISIDRKRARDLPKDKDGKIIVDLANPHILEDMDYFRPSALFFKKHGKYTLLKPNGNPNSEYGKWLRTERDRCWKGYVRESDGEWIPGPLYFYINYCPIILSKIIEGTKKAQRVVDFPEIWEGIYLRFHYMHQARHGGLYNDFKGGNHCAELSSRGKSKSYSMASVLTHNFILGENEESNKNVASAVTAYQKEYLIKDGVLNKFLSMADFNAEHTQFPRKRLKNSLQEMNWEMGYKDADLNIDKGTRNSVLGVSSKDDTSKLRGKRSVFIGVEEYGTFPRLLDLYNVLLPSVQDGDYVFGLLYLQGTAGDNESDFAGAQEIMYNPKGYNMYHIPNIYDKITQGKPFFIYFFPGYLNRKGCYNKDGVSDVIAALIEILKHRHTVKHNSSDPNTILRIVAEVPITPSEAILKIGGNYFPIKDLTERLGELDSNPREMDDIYVGELILDKLGQPQFKITSNSPIRDFPHKDNKIEGAVEIYKMPEKNADGKVYTDRYIVGCDPYDDDTSTTLSLGSYYVLDLWTDQIVAEYTGRPLLANDFYEIGRRLTLFFNAKMNYENNKKGLFAYFSQMNCLYLLTDTLEFLKDQDYVKGTTYGNKAKGVNANAAINNYARMLIRNWLLKPMKFQHIVDGEETEIVLPTLYKLKCRALLKELILYNQEGNFDRVSALGMLMLYREDKMIMYQGDFSKNRKDEREADYLGNDPFFKR